MSSHERLSTTVEQSSDRICELSVVVPVFNEEPLNLDRLLERLEQVLSPLSISYEVVFVDDGSEERTAQALRKLAGELDYIKLVVLSRNFGELAALSAGLDHSSGLAVISMDSDLQDPPELLPTMIRYWRDGYDVVCTQQASRQDSWAKNLSAILFYRLLGAVSDVQIPLDVAEFRLLSRKAIDALSRLPEKARFLRGLVPWIGLKQIVIPFHRHARTFGEGHYSLEKLISLAVDGLVTFSAMPLFLIAFLGIGLIFSGIACLVTAGFCGVQAAFGVSLALMSIALLLTGLQIFSMGVVAVYLSQVLKETRARPTYLVADRLSRAGYKAAPHSLHRLETAVETGNEKVPEDSTIL